jgi:hypothetical protein
MRQIGLRDVILLVFTQQEEAVFEFILLVWERRIEKKQTLFLHCQIQTRLIPAALSCFYAVMSCLVLSCVVSIPNISFASLALGWKEKEYTKLFLKVALLWVDFWAC